MVALPRLVLLVVVSLICCWVASPVLAQDPSRFYNQQVAPLDWPQLGGSPSRNNAVAQQVPTHWEFETERPTRTIIPGTNVKWTARLGSQSYGTPIVANGHVYLATNNAAGRVKEYPSKVDLGCLVCFKTTDGKFVWQYSAPKLATGRKHDWPLQGICSNPVVEGDRLWLVDNRGQVVCLDTEGFHDAEDDGPVIDQTIQYTIEEQTHRKKLGVDTPQHADVVWRLDMMNQLGTRQHNMATCSPTIWGDLLFICTSNGVDETHINIPAPEAPSFICLDKHTGEVVWTDNSPGKMILHGQWSSPAAGMLGGVQQVIFAGGDGYLRSFRADRGVDGKPTLLWKFDANAKETVWRLGGRGTRNNIVATPMIYQERVYFATGQDVEHGEGTATLYCIDPTKRGDVSAELLLGADGKPAQADRYHAASRMRQLFKQTSYNAWDAVGDLTASHELRALFKKAGIDLPEEVTVTLSKNPPVIYREVEAKINGEVQRWGLRRHRREANQKSDGISIVQLRKVKVVPNPNSAVVWKYTHADLNGNGEIEFEETLHRSIASPVIKNGLLIQVDFSGMVHCLNAYTGEPHWTYDLLAANWFTPLIAGQHIYVPDEDGEVAIFRLSASSAEAMGNQDHPPEIYMNASIYSAPTVAGGVLYISTRRDLFAIEQEPPQ